MHVLDAMGKYLETWKNDFDCRYVVPVPSHRAGQVCEFSQLICCFICYEFPWLNYPERLLFRKESIRASHQSLPDQRPTYGEHLKSLGCENVDLKRAGVILFDDVRTTGTTSQACRGRLQQDTNCGEVVRVFLGDVDV